jgi:hypothetical protein
MMKSSKKSQTALFLVFISLFCGTFVKGADGSEFSEEFWIPGASSFGY